MPKETVSVTFTESCNIKDADEKIVQSFDEGKTYKMNVESAKRWVRRNMAVYASEADAAKAIEMVDLQTASRTIEKAKTEAAKIVQGAKAEAEKIVAKANASADAAKAEAKAATDEAAKTVEAAKAEAAKLVEDAKTEAAKLKKEAEVLK